MDEVKVKEPIAAQPNEEKKAKATKKPTKAKNVAPVATGRVYIQATYNNTIITITDLNGNVLGWASAGLVGFRGPKKATPFAASQIVKKALEGIAERGLKEVYVFVKGIGSGREASVRALNANGLNVLSIKDMTPMPHNGPRPVKPRRV